ncbi:hypothetical protein LNO89_29830 [Klebsiella pneumoniae subsp. pneumoniae]|nr:hypothetical protein [Klebsiella pneumoniae subsp. pneumoniae]
MFAGLVVKSLLFFCRILPVVTAERIAERIRSVIESTVFTNDLRVTTYLLGVATQTDPLSGIDFFAEKC